MKHFAFLCLALAVVGCNQSHGLPAPLVLRILGISPARGSTFGGTQVTITGRGFGSTAEVRIGGAPATDVVVVNETTITAKTPQHTVGGTDVVVTSNGLTASLPGGFIFEVPSVGPNAAPVILGLTARGTRANQPNAMANLGETINVTLSLTDTETPIDELTYLWSSPQGTFVGAGRALQWRAPSTLSTSPTDFVLTVTVVEPYVAIDPQGLPVPSEHRITQTITVRVHDSLRDISELAVEFLEAFSNSGISPTQVMSGFSQTCQGGGPYRAELADVEKNRCLYTITSHTVGAPATTQTFRGLCSIGTGTAPRTHIADGCAIVPVRWVSVVKPGAASCPAQEPGPNGAPLVPGMQITTTGEDMVTAMYENGQWRLCHSEFIGMSTTPVGTFQGFKK